MPSSGYMSTQSGDFPAIAPLDVAGPNPAPAPPAGTPPGAAPPADRGPQAAPSSFDQKPAAPTPSVATADYDPATGRYLAPDGKLYQQSDLVTSTAPKKWQDMFPN
jgi:phospholipid/cholesterol/gamma-HCH transport system substrate-binding protein